MSSGLHRGNCAQTCLCELHLVDMHTQAMPTSVGPLGAAEKLNMKFALAAFPSANGASEACGVGDWAPLSHEPLRQPSGTLLVLCVCT